MNCGACGRPLPAEAVVCSNCGTFTPLYYSRLGSSPYDPTVAASSEVGKSPMPPPHYGSGPSNGPPGEYARNPYEATPPPPPQTPAPMEGEPEGSYRRRARGTGDPACAYWSDGGTAAKYQPIWSHAGP